MSFDLLSFACFTFIFSLSLRIKNILILGVLDGNFFDFFLFIEVLLPFFRFFNIIYNILIIKDEFQVSFIFLFIFYLAADQVLLWIELKPGFGLFFATL